MTIEIENQQTLSDTTAPLWIDPVLGILLILNAANGADRCSQNRICRMLLVAAGLEEYWQLSETSCLRADADEATPRRRAALLYVDALYRREPPDPQLREQLPEALDRLLDALVRAASSSISDSYSWKEILDEHEGDSPWWYTWEEDDEGDEAA